MTAMAITATTPKPRQPELLQQAQEIAREVAGRSPTHDEARALYQLSPTGRR